MVGTFSGLSFDSVGAFPVRSQLPLGCVLPSDVGPSQHEIPDLKVTRDHLSVEAPDDSPFNHGLNKRSLVSYLLARSSSSRIACSLSSLFRGYRVLHVSSLTSTGMTASVPYVRRKGVSPVVECGVV